MTSIETELPRAQLQTCYFHFTQSLWRKVQDLGLAHDYRHSRRLAQLIRKVMATGYLPLAVLAMNFDRLVAERESRRVIRRFPEVQNFIGYFRRTYIGPQATFPPPTWCVSDRHMDQRTNDHAEGQPVFLFLSFFPISLLANRPMQKYHNL